MVEGPGEVLGGAETVRLAEVTGGQGIPEEADIRQAKGAGQFAVSFDASRLPMPEACPVDTGGDK